MKKNYPQHLKAMAVLWSFCCITLLSFSQTTSPAFDLDTKPPVVSITNGFSGQYEVGDGVEVTWSATDDNIALAAVTIGIYDVAMDHLFVLKESIANESPVLVPLIYPTNGGRMVVMVRDEFGNIGSDTSNITFIVNGGYNLGGYVLEQGTSNPIHEAKVSAVLSRADYIDSTNTEGFFEIQNLPAGDYNISVSKNGYSSLSFNKPINKDTLINVYLTKTGASPIRINDDLSIYFDEAVKEQVTGGLLLRGNVNINGILKFNGDVILDNRPHLNYPEIQGYCTYSAADINGQDEMIKTGSESFHFYCKGNRLIAKGLGFLNYWVGIGGLNIEGGILEIDKNGQSLECKYLLELPFPLWNVIKHYRQNTPFEPLFTKVGGSKIYSKANGVNISLNITGVDAKFSLFDIKAFNISYSSVDHTINGGFKFQFPGSVPKGRSVSDSAFLKLIPVKQVNSIGDTTFYENLDQFLMSNRVFGKEGLELAFSFEIINGEINSLIFAVGTEFPLFSTGLKVTEVRGGFKDLLKKEWKFVATVDLEPVAFDSIPYLGKPVEIEDLGVEISPWDYFKGSGKLEIFRWDVANTSLEYIPSKSAVTFDGNFNLAEILKGRLYGYYNNGDFRAGGNLSLTTPPNLPFGFGYLANRKIGSAEARLIRDISGSETIWKMIAAARWKVFSFAIQLKFDNPEAPWYTATIGNYESLSEISRGNTMGGREIIQFIVQENSEQLVVVATGETDTINFYLEDPNGVIYDSTNSVYLGFPETYETVISVDQPIDGVWNFITDATIPYEMASMNRNQPPSLLLHQPANRRTRSNQINFSFNDYADTLDVKVYYDTDNKNFDGTFIQQFEVLNNASPDFTWKNDTIPNGEYFIYVVVDDGYNAPVSQYAPGSILVQNEVLTETIQNMQLSQVGDSILVSFDSTDYQFAMAVLINYKRITDNYHQQVLVVDSNSCYISDFEMGKQYDVWGQYLYNSGNIGPASETMSIVPLTSARNNPPYFLMDPDSTWTFIEGEQAQYNLLAADADNNALTYSIVDDTLGMTLNANVVSWTPADTSLGAYNIRFSVTDGVSYDTIYQYMVVYSQQQMEVDLNFSSVNLYESDNMFIKLRNYDESNTTATVKLKNLSSQDSVNITCQKVNDFEFIGQFALSFSSRTAINVSHGDTIEASYFYIDSTYTAISYYDSLPQPSDVIAPAQISDLEVVPQGGNEIMLKWTAPGDDGTSGFAYRYDIRFHFDTIANDYDYLVSHLYQIFHPPLEPGTTDSIIIDLATIDSIHMFNKIWWAIVTEDEMYNRSDFGITAGYEYNLAPYNLETEIINEKTIKLDWEGPVPETARDTISFVGYNIYRSKDSTDFITIDTALDVTTYTDVIFNNQNGMYTYGIQAVYSNNERSDTLFSEPAELGLYTPLRVFIDCMDSVNNNNVLFSITSVDSIYPESYHRTTRESGVLLFANVVKGDYYVHISKGRYASIIDTITINSQQYEYAFELHPLISLSNDSIHISSDTNSLFLRNIVVTNRAGYAVNYSVTATEDDPGLSWIDVVSPNSIIAANSVDTLWLQVNTQSLFSGEDYSAEVSFSFPDSVSSTHTLPVLLQTYANQVLNISAGWSGISGYVNPINDSITSIFSEVEDDVVIITGSNGMWWPSQGINTLMNWDYLSGYSIKANSNIQVPLYGLMSPTKTLSLNAGWTLIPILSRGVVNTEQMFSPLGDTLVLIKDVSGVGLYWPSQGINSLETLIPGKAYYLNALYNFEVTFPETQRTDPLMGNSGVEIDRPDTWNRIITTQSSHTIGLTSEAVSLFEPGDYIGVFSQSGHCFGSVKIAKQGVPVGFNAFADDLTTDAVDGFQYYERMDYRLFKTSTDQEYDLKPIFNSTYTNGEQFENNGVSLIEGFDDAWEIPKNQLNQINVRIYPVPARERLFVDVSGNDNAEFDVKIFNPSGLLLGTYSFSSETGKLDISHLSAGVYTLRLESKDAVIFEKFVVK